MIVTLLTYSYTIITISLLWLFIRKSLIQKEDLKKNVLWWWLFGGIFNFLSLSVVYSTYPLPWLQDGVTQLFWIFLFHIVLTFVASIPYSLVGISFKIKNNSQYNPFIFASFLCFAEILRSLCISLINYGEGSLSSLHFTVATVGNALSSTPFIEYAYFGGTFALTFVIGYLVYIGSTEETLKKYWIHALGSVLLLIGIHYLIPTYGPPTSTTVGVMTTDFKRSDESTAKKMFEESTVLLKNMTLSLSSSSVDILLYPEDARFLSHLSETDRESLFSLFPNTLFIDGSTSKVDNKLLNVSFFYNATLQKAQQRGKQFLFPFNEYIPFVFIPFTSLFIPKDEVVSYLKKHTYTPISSDMTIPFKSFRIGTLICSEIISFTVLQHLKREKPSLVFFQARYEIFHKNPLFIMHLYSFTKVAAAQMRRPVISSSNGAPSLIISPHGAIIDTVPAGFTTKIYSFTKKEN